MDKRDLIKYVACPSCGGDLTLYDDSGVICEGCGFTDDLVAGAPT